ncbi:metalloprotease [Ephemerocybe angulata]|uniref:Metalloprotease n=1 Tax=Ephemerocybe angulata TaxID=980116 RepID=A0A8H6HI46_9AGAR|nr:metalloprotease [Tulosesus angulatus]
MTTQLRSTMSTMFARVFLAFALFSAVTTVAGAPAFHKDIRRHRRKRAATEARFKTSRVPPTHENATAVIDVYFHVIYANETLEAGFVTDESIKRQVEVLNGDYSSTGISFDLKNISRIQSEDWFLRVAPNSKGDETVRNGEASVLNVWTVGFMEGDGQGLLGYATFPADYEKDPLLDGVVLLHSTLPDVGKAPYNGGRTLTHESGHWFGLYHTFEGGCTGPNDYVDDTPPVKDAAYGCPSKRSTCPGGLTDDTTNFMDYTDDKCMTGFSEGQATRMRAQLRTFRGVDV